MPIARAPAMSVRRRSPTCSARSAGTSPSEVSARAKIGRVGLVDADLVGERPAVEVLEHAAALEEAAQQLAAGEADVADDPGADALRLELGQRLLEPVVDDQVGRRARVGERLDEVVAQPLGDGDPRSSTARSAAITGVNWRPARQCSEWIRHVSSNVRRTVSGGTSLSRSSSLQRACGAPSAIRRASRAIVSQKS